MTVAYIGLGANLGDASAALDGALAELAALPGTRLDAVAPRYRTAPVDASGPDYLNTAARIETALGPHALLAALQAIENRHGRERPYRHAPRTLDLDLLLFGDETIATPTLTVPHPRLVQRAFVLRPLLALDAALALPGGTRLADCLAGVADQRIDEVAA